MGSTASALVFHLRRLSSLSMNVTRNSENTSTDVENKACLLRDTVNALMSPEAAENTGAAENTASGVNTSGTNVENTAVVLSGRQMHFEGAGGETRQSSSSL